MTKFDEDMIEMLKSLPGQIERADISKNPVVVFVDAFRQTLEGSHLSTSDVEILTMNLRLDITYHGDDVEKFETFGHLMAEAILKLLENEELKKLHPLTLRAILKQISFKYEQ